MSKTDNILNMTLLEFEKYISEILKSDTGDKQKVLCYSPLKGIVIKKGDLGVRIVIDPDIAALTYHPIKLFPTQSNLKAVSFYYLNNDSDIILCKKVVMRKEGEEWKIFAVHYFSHSGTIDTLRGEDLCKDTLKVSNLLYDEVV